MGKAQGTYIIYTSEVLNKWHMESLCESSADLILQILQIRVEIENKWRAWTWGIQITIKKHANQDLRRSYHEADVERHTVSSGHTDCSVTFSSAIACSLASLARCTCSDSASVSQLRKNAGENSASWIFLACTLWVQAPHLFTIFIVCQQSSSSSVSSSTYVSSSSCVAVTCSEANNIDVQQHNKITKTNILTSMK